MDDLYDAHSGVVELNDQNFVKKHGTFHLKYPELNGRYGLIVFYAPWCPHCKEMVELWSDLALEYQHSFFFGAVNCENQANHVLCSQFKIDGYPTFKHVSKNGVITDYNDKTDRDTILYNVCCRI